MKLVIILLMTTTFGFVNAKSFAQRISLVKKKIRIEEALLEIRKQTGYNFFYDQEMLRKSKPFDIAVVDMPLKEVLDLCFKDQPLTYVVDRNTVVIRTLSVSERLSQEIRITGRVADAEGKPLPGVNVKVKGTTKGSITDIEGKYAITVMDKNSVLVFTFVGYSELETPIAGRTSVDVVMKETVSVLEDVVVVGYGVVRKSDLTGAVSQIKAEDINAYPSASVLQALSGRAPGIQIRQGSGAPGSSVTVRIRGGNSIQGSNEPLYVIDGFPINGNPTHLNNADIESVELLKDASATAIYGSRGANGVVIITTKKGRPGRSMVNFETSYSTQSLIRKLDLMNAREYATFYNEQRVNDNLGAYFTQSQIDSMGEGFDWQDFVFQTAPMLSTALNVNGGNEKTQFSLSGSIFGQNGIIKGSDYNRYSLVSSLNHQISDKFSVDFSSTLSRLTTKRKDSGGGNRGNSMISAAVSAPPTLEPLNADGSYRVLSRAYPFIATDLVNPINFINEQSSEIKANVILANAAVNYHITPELVLKIAGGIENRDERTDVYTTTNFFNSLGSASASAGQFTSLLNENTLNYNKAFGQHKIAAVAGFTYQNFLNTSLSASGSGFLSDNFESYNLGAASNPNVPSSGYIKSVLISWLGRVNYNFGDKYLATLSIRRDGSSRYSEGSKWGYFPSGALAWRISNEDFLKDNKVISDLKLRTSWGLTGSQAIDPYRTLNTLIAGRTIFNDEYANTFAPGTVYPGDLKWETTEQLDAGFDLGLLKNRLQLTADFYLKKTRDLLSTVRLPSSVGYTSSTRNVGSIQNKGMEFNIDARLLEGPFAWNVNANIAFNRNKVLELYNGEDLLRDNISVVVINDVTSILREGQPVGRFWGYLEDGYDSNGNIVFRDLDGDGTISQNDKTYIGDPNPDYIYGFNSTIRYKNFELDIFIQGMHGNDIFNASAITNTLDYGFGLNMTREVYANHWTPENPDAKYPRISNSTAVRVSDRLIEDGSYLRLKNITLAYNIPATLLKEKWVRNLQVYASGQNLLTKTDYSWWDPETNFRLDHNSYPNSKVITFGVRAGF